MTDVLSIEQRRRCMSRIKGVDTKPELKLRSILHALGMRYRLHVSDLPGKPDLVFRKFRCVVFVHGCFWHRHRGCRLSATPSNNREFWIEKLSQNVQRDKAQVELLMNGGWRVIVIWECGLKKPCEDFRWLVDQIKYGEERCFEWPALKPI